MDRSVRIYIFYVFGTRWWVVVAVTFAKISMKSKMQGTFVQRGHLLQAQEVTICSPGTFHVLLKG